MKMRKWLVLLLAMTLLLAACTTATETKPDTTEAVASEPVSGTFRGEGNGKYGPFVVDVTLDDSVITDITVVENEDSSFTDPVVKEMIAAMLDTNSTEVDAVAGATLTSFGLRFAATEAIKASGAVLEEKASTTEAPQMTDTETDIVVIGSGGAGLSAAIEATQNGADVIVLEKNGFTGGNTNFATGGMNAAGTKHQEAANIEDSPALHYEDTMKGGHDLNDPALLTVLTENAAEAVDWLESIGASMAEVGRSGGQSVNRIHKGPDGMPIGTHLMEVFMKNAEEMDIDVRLYNKAIELLHDGNTVTGVKVEYKDGQTYDIKAKAVILATGGFGANPELVTKYKEELEGFGTTNSIGATGDALALVEPLNVALTDIEQIQTHPTVVPKANEMITEGVRGDGAILVNRSGERFTDELLTRDVVSQAILAQEGATAFLILDSNVFNAASAYKDYMDQGYIKEGPELADIAEIIGCDPETLEKTVQSYTDSVKAGNDEAFGRTSLDVDLSEGPYYTVEVGPAIHHTMGGLKIDTSGEVINNDGQPVEGLYAAGEVTGGVHGGNRIGGNAVADIVVFGRIAGQNASEYIKNAE